jgi:hypothetical protein
MKLFLLALTLTLIQISDQQLFDKNTRPCIIETKNPMAYTCSALGFTFPTSNVCSSNLGCAQTDIQNITTTASSTLNFYSPGQYSCTSVNPNYVIKCIAFAGAGKVGGACAQMDTVDNPRGEICDFKEDPSGTFVWLPEEIGLACIGKKDCNVTQTNRGFAYEGVTYDIYSTIGKKQVHSLTSCCSGTQVKFKMVVACGPPTTNVTYTACGTSSDAPSVVFSSLFILLNFLFLIL